jgi:hypothetical protein
MGLGLALVVLGALILLDRMGVGYGLREGWPWIVVALGIGGLFRNRKSLPAWITTLIGILLVGTKYYSVQMSIPGAVKIYFVPVLLIIIGILWIWRYKKD